LIINLGTLVCLPGLSQNQIRLYGSVHDAETKEPLRGATVFIKSLSFGTASDENGKFEINVSNGKHSIDFSFIGYESAHIDTLINQSINLSIFLSPIANTIQEVEISDTRAQEKITETETGLITLTKKELENLPYMFGEADPIRILQLLPGVQTAGEGNTGFYVRGGAVDQNLMLLDNSIIYNPSHLFGFFSVFNGSVINSVDLYKSGVPSFYGGRLSSITKINTRKGNDTEIKGEGSLGVIAANLLIEGPIKKNKGSFLIAGRRTYVDLLMNSLRNVLSIPEKLNYYFYDLNINADYSVALRDKISLRSYSGKDNFKYETGSSFANRIKWGNRTTSLHWVHQYNEKLFGELTMSSVSYDMDFGASINNYNFQIASSIRDNGFTYRLDLKENKHDVAMGITYTRHAVRPNNINASSADVELDFNSNVKLNADEAAIFVNDKFSINEKVELSYGIRFSGFSQLGAFTRYVEDENLQIIDTIKYSKNKRIQNYVKAEPRFAMRYSVGESSSVKISFDRAYQYMHMAPLSSASLPMDTWVTSSSVVKPQSVNQYSAGYFRNFFTNTLEGSFVVYYKSMQHQMEYKDGVIIGYSKGFNYDDNFVFGSGKSYGAEFLLKKNSGRVTGMLGYTLSRTTRKFEDLNKGKSFPAKYDRLHDVSITVNYSHNKRWTFSSVFVYGTGNALNLPVARYVIQGNVVNEYGSRNSFRMPAYHRLDLAAVYTVKKTKKFEAAWIFSIYNVYNRRNPYYIYFETKGDLKDYKLQTNLKQVSLFPILPSVSYRLKF
jgi:hypothetical protein